MHPPHGREDHGHKGRQPKCRCNQNNCTVSPQRRGGFCLCVVAQQGGRLIGKETIASVPIRRWSGHSQLGLGHFQTTTPKLWPVVLVLTSRHGAPITRDGLNSFPVAAPISCQSLIVGKEPRSSPADAMSHDSMSSSMLHTKAGGVLGGKMETDLPGRLWDGRVLV